jgi:valyl-tRNA synthetase
VVALTGAIDLGQECRRLSDELTRLDKQLEGLVAKLANEQFIARAPQDVVTRERQKEQAWRTQRDALAGKLAALGCG